MTEVLAYEQDWVHLKSLWDGVIARQRKFYNEVWKLEKDDPGKLPSRTMDASREALLESLRYVKALAVDLGQPQDAEKYMEMIGRVQRRRKA